MDTQEKHRLLVSYIHKYGDSFPKRHGNWIKLKLFKDYYLSLDSWNRNIFFLKGAAEYNEGTGFGRFGRDFKDKKICFLGANFGGFVEPEREETLDWILNIIQLEKQDLRND